MEHIKYKEESYAIIGKCMEVHNNLESHPLEQALRLLGISISNLDTESWSEGGQLTLDF